jgi:hypothetical protein
MATTRSFQDMLNEYLTYDLLREELVKRDYVLQRVEKDDGWKGGNLIVPFKGAGASSVKFGGLTANNDIAEDLYVRGQVSAYKECWGSMIFNYSDLVQHDTGQINEDTFLRVLPDQIEDFMEYYKQVVSIQLTTGPNFATAVSNGLAGGTIQVDRVDRFYINQKVLLDDNDTAAGTFYVIAIDVNNGVAGFPGSGNITLSATRGGAAADISAYTIAQAAVFYHDGVDVTGVDTFTSLRSQLLSAANGGSANLFGQSKLAYPYLQAVQVDGSTMTAANILEQIFDAHTSVKTKAKGMANEVLMSWNRLGAAMKVLETQKGGFKVRPDSEEASQYGWMKITIGSVAGMYLTLVGIQEMDDDVMYFMDWNAVKMHSNGLIRKHKSPDGLEYYVVRNTTGYQYICDIAMYGELVVSKPGHCGVIHGISF